MRGFFVYFRAQLKRCLCFWPKILVLTLISAICIASFAYNTLQSKAEEEEASALKLKIGVCGDLRDTYLDLAVFALQNFDSSQYYAEMVTMSEEEAAEKLSRGEISGYVIVPEGYVEAVVAGEELQVTYVMNESPATIVPMLMKEVIETISDYVVESETSIYSYTKICRERGIPRSEYRIDADNMSLACLERILSRTSVVKTEVAEGDGVSFESYYICAFFILLLLLWGMTWSPLFVKKDGLLLKMLYFRGMSAPAQLAGELLAYFAASVFNLVIAAGVLVVAVLFAGKGIPDALGSDFLGLGLLLLRILPVQLIVCTLQFFMFELCSSIISGTFLQLVATVALSLVSGFFYPKQSLPESVSAFGSVTPTGCAFTYMTDVFSGRGGWLSLAAVLLWAAVFAALSCIVRMRKIRGVEE